MRKRTWITTERQRPPAEQKTRSDSTGLLLAAFGLLVGGISLAIATGAPMLFWAAVGGAFVCAITSVVVRTGERIIDAIDRQG